MVELAHDSPDCAGRWQRVEAGGRAVQWRCSGCGALYADSTAVRFAVLRDYDLDLVVARLLREGRKLLARPRDGGPGGGPRPRP